MARVRITKIPKALSGLEVKMSAGLYGKPTNGNRQFTLPNQIMSQKFAQEPTTVRNTLQPVAREGANLEAEKGETAVMSLGGLPAHFKIGGKRHSQGGTPLNLPDNSFIFSDTAKMKIKDPIIIAQFGMVPKKAGYTPAEIAKKFDINKFRQILADPNSEDLQRKTAEAMISNYNLKLAKLALIQESMKGFPQGIPAIAMPYIIENDIDPSSYLPTQSQEEEPDADTGEARYGGNMVAQFNTKRYGGLPTAQVGRQKVPGFGESFNTQTEEEFGTNYPGVYNIYRQALASNDPIKMNEAASLIAQSQTSQTPWYSLDVIPGSDADMFENLSTILKEQAGKIKSQAKYNTVKSKITEKTKDIPNKVKGIYGQLLNEYESIPNEDYINKLKKSTEIKEFEKYLPEKKGRFLPSSINQPWQLYSESDADMINNLYNNKFKKAQEQITTKVNTKPKENIEVEELEEKPVKDVEVKKKPAAKAVTNVEEVKTSSSRKPLHNWD